MENKKYPNAIHLYPSIHSNVGLTCDAVNFQVGSVTGVRLHPNQTSSGLKVLSYTDRAGTSKLLHAG